MKYIKKISQCFMIILIILFSVINISCDRSKMPKDKVEVKLLIDGNKYSYEWDYGESFLFDLKEEFPDLLYFSYYLDKEYKNYYKIEPLTDDITLYVKTFKEPKNELIEKVKKDFFSKYNHELRGECFMQINNDIFIISYSDILDFDSEYAVRNGIISNVRLNGVSFIFPYEKSSLALWSDGIFYFNKEIESKIHKNECAFLGKNFNEENKQFEKLNTEFSVKIKENLYTIIPDSTYYRMYENLLEKNELISLHTIYDFDGQINLGNKIVFTVIGANGSNNVHNNCINLKICRCFDGSNVDECVFYDELMKLDFVEEIYINYHNVEPKGSYCR